MIIFSALLFLAIVNGLIYVSVIEPKVHHENIGQMPNYGFPFFTTVKKYYQIVNNKRQLSKWSYGIYLVESSLTVLVILSVILFTAH